MTNPRAEFEERFVRPAPGRALIVGSHVYGGRQDARQRFADAVGVDMFAGPGVDVVHDMEEDCSALGAFAHVECRSVLEHSRRPWLLAAGIEQVLRPGGTLYLSAPFVWRFHAYPDDYYRFTHAGIEALFPGIEWTALMYAGDRLYGSRDRLRAMHGAGEHPYMPRTEIVGFGVRKD